MSAAAVLELPPVQQRKVAAIVGACVADAAAQPLHWIYQDSKMEALLEGKEEIEFRDPSENPFYRIPTGNNSCYGDQSYVVLKSLVENKGLNVENLTKETFDFFGPESAYECAETDKYVVGKEDKINIKKTLPISGPWRHGAIKEFLKNMYAKKTPPGAEADDQIDGAIRMIPLVALYAGNPDMLDKVEAGLRVLQESDLAIACALAAARVLELYILNGNPENVIDTVVEAVSSPDNPSPQDLDRAVVGQLRGVAKVTGVNHAEAVPKFFKKN